MDAIREKLRQLRLEADAAFGQAENAETNDKQLQGGLYVQAQDLTGLQYRLSVLETANEKLREFKTSPFNSDDIKMAVENLTRNLQLLVEELDAAEKNLKETVEKSRQVDVKAEDYESQVVRAEKERDAWEKTYEELNEKYRKALTDLDDLEKTTGMQDLQV